MKKIKEILYDKKFYLFMLVVIIFFGIFFKLEYATDTYTVFANGTKDTVLHFFSSGRFVTGMCQLAIRVLHISNYLTYIISFLLAIISLTIALYKLYKIVHEDVQEILISSIICVLVLINVFSIELFLYIEKGILAFSVLLNVLAVRKVNRIF